MVSTDIGNINSVANSYLRFEEPRSFFAPMSYGNGGYALPTIIGAKVVAPHRPAISDAGDGAWGMSMSEIMTCVHHDIPVTAVEFHNRQWGAENGARRKRIKSISTTRWLAAIRLSRPVVRLDHSPVGERQGAAAGRPGRRRPPRQWRVAVRATQRQVSRDHDGLLTAR